MTDEYGFDDPFDDPDDEVACEDCGHIGPVGGFHSCDDEAQ